MRARLAFQGPGLADRKKAFCMITGGSLVTYFPYRWWTMCLSLLEV